jgi:hypothetical protein
MMNNMSTFTKTILFTDTDGRARFREEVLALDQGSPQARLSALMHSGGYQLRHSPVGFRSAFHVSPHPQWVFILAGQMEIGLQDGSSRIFNPGEHFYSADLLPEGAEFDPHLHGHWSCQRGPDPLVTLFVRG